MKDAHRQLTHRCGRMAGVVSALLLIAPCVVLAQAAPAPAPSKAPRDIPRPDELEPGVNTTPSSAPGTSSPAPTSSAPGPAPAATPAPPPASASSATAPSTGGPGAAKPAGAAAGAAGGAAKTSGPGQKETAAKNAGRKGPDRLELDATDITGNRELPKVLYIVPWKRSDLGDVVGKPVNSLLDEVLQPLDRDVFRRENRYYDALPGGAGDVKAGTAQGSPNKP